MQAVVFTKYGSADVLHVTEVEKPIPHDDQVLVQVRAVSINDWDWEALQGTPFVNRLMFGLRKPRPNRRIMGSDIAGVVEAVGKSVRRFQPGDEVFGDLSGGGWGGFAEYVCAREDDLVRKSPGMTFEQAASIPQAAMLALQAFRKAGLRDGQKILINGAGGGVGTFAIQIAKQYGAEITAVDSGAKLEMLRALGAAHVIDYTREDFTKRGEEYDLILDVKTLRSIFDCARAVKRGGVYVTVGGSLSRLFQWLWVAPWMSLIRKRHFRILALKPNKGLDEMNRLFEEGKLTPVIDGSYTLSELPQAMKFFGESKHKGKVVISAGAVALPRHSA